jgi:hypothetical protein
MKIGRVVMAIATYQESQLGRVKSLINQELPYDKLTFLVSREGHNHWADFLDF